MLFLDSSKKTLVVKEHNYAHTYCMYTCNMNEIRIYLLEECVEIHTYQ